MTAIQCAPHDFYPSYEGLRDSILQTRVGRNVLLRGGILWRLSKHIVPIEAVLAGPTYANELVASDKSTSYYDDALCQSTAELIVGVFRFEGAIRGIRSYWPRYETFIGSGYDGGQWLPDAERWYVHHLEGLQSGGQPLKASRTWTADLKRNVKAARPIMEASERLAESFIANYMVSDLTLVPVSLVLIRTFQSVTIESVNVPY
ncbi:hypothetical protein BDN71DRAFT_1404478 [Pleurotus eryngii]|uniref:Uncharacterized protein n=1 Tax=Pleurotus eryngii TaxID=5323 RepID=A0A9P6D0I3_PLEER|nr:hypothetical protein BDN71DRAFT_1404478 [Pleurotus eryngii]